MAAPAQLDISSGLRSLVHSHAEPCSPSIPYTFRKPCPTGGGAVAVRDAYISSIRRMNAGSREPSRLVSLAAATYSHSSVVGSLLPCASQYAAAAYQETDVTGLCRSVASPGSSTRSEEHTSEL